MQSEEFKLTLIKQYTEYVERIIVESESVYKSKIDYNFLNNRMNSLLDSALVDGLDEETIWGIVKQKIPNYFEMRIPLKNVA